MPCDYTTNYTIGCRDSNQGGVKRIFIGAYSGSTTYLLNSEDIITGATSGVTRFYEIQQLPQTAEWNVEGVHTNGSNSVTSTLNLQFYKYQASLRKFILTMVAQNSNVIIQDYSDKYFLFADTPAIVTASKFGVGKELGALNGGTVTLTAFSPKLPYEISSTYFGTFTII